MWPEVCFPNCWCREKGRPAASSWKCPQGQPYITFSEACVVRLHHTQLALQEWTTLSLTPLFKHIPPGPLSHLLGLGKGKELLLCCCFKSHAITSISQSCRWQYSCSEVAPWNLKAFFQVIACSVISILTVNCAIGHSAVGIHNSSFIQTPIPDLNQCELYSHSLAPIISRYNTPKWIFNITNRQNSLLSFAWGKTDEATGPAIEMVFKKLIYKSVFKTHLSWFFPCWYNGKFE